LFAKSYNFICYIINLKLISMKNFNLSAAILLSFLFSACTKQDNPITPTVVVPTVTIAAVNIADVDFNTAKVNGTVTISDESKLTEKGIVYGLSPAPTLTDSAKVVTSNTIALNITNLKMGTKYYACGYAKANGQTYYSSEVNFTTRTLTGTTWDFFHTFSAQISWHANVTFNADGTTKYDEPDSPGTYLNIGKWKIANNILTFALKGDYTATSYVYTGITSSTGLTGTFNFGTDAPKVWTAVLK
jgi:hypothetical protein